MEYISEHSGSPIVSPNNGYWIHDHTVYDVTTSTHVRFLIEHTDLFQISMDTIRIIYGLRDEPIGTEGRARDELIKLATTRGWVRIRHYSKPTDYWSIQADSSLKRKQTIKGFIEWALQNSIMMDHDAAVILGFDDPTDRHEYGWESGGVKTYLNEWRRA